MVRLVPMTETEFESYADLSLKEYARDHVRAGNFEPENAIEQACEQVNGLLPEGLSTEGHHLCSIQDDSGQTKVGVLWYAIDDQGGAEESICL